MTSNRYLALAALAFLSACGGKPTSPPAPVPDTPSVSEPAPQPVTPPVPLGQIGRAQGVELTLKSLEQRSQVGSDSYGRKAGPDETYVVVKYTIKNTASKPLPSDERPSMVLLDGQGQSYSDDGAAGLAVGGMGGALEDVNPGTSAEAALVWKVGKAAFDPASWKIVAASEPQLTFALK